MLKTVLLLFVQTESSREQHLFGIEIFENILDAYFELKNPHI